MPLYTFEDLLQPSSLLVDWGQKAIAKNAFRTGRETEHAMNYINIKTIH